MPHFPKAGDKGQAPTVPYAVGRDNVVPIGQKRADKLAVLETPDADLIAARERADRNLEALTGERAPFTPAEARQTVARHIDEARTKLLAAGQMCADRDDLRAIHARVASVALEVETLLSDLADTGSAA